METQLEGVNRENVPLGFGDVTASVGDPIGHFYRGSDKMFSVLLIPRLARQTPSRIIGA
ncbi:hypothetical protein IH992_28505 [Candidatus Poribacteria bacterium]|nr:hypothetical protein [Candidatus Poribacteria bacterium]